MTFYTGNTGRSTGAHLDARVWDVEKGAYVDPTSFMDRLLVNGQPLTQQYGVTSGYGMREHPVTGGQKMHHGIDYGTPEGTPVTIKNGTFLSTFNDAGGGITSQYGITGDDGRSYEILLMHGSDANKITNDAAVTGGTPAGNASVGFNQPDSGEARSSAKQKAKDFSQMSKAELNAAYDANRDKEVGMQMHKAYFKKP